MPIVLCRGAGPYGGGVEPFAAVVPAGGRASRLGGVHKPGLEVGGSTLLDRVLAAVGAAEVRIVVGPPQPVPAGTAIVREDPPGGGPVAAIAAGLAAIPDVPFVAVLAADLPFLTAAAVADLRAAGASADGALLTDAGGRDQYLASVWRTEALRRALASLGDPAGASVRSLLAGLDAVRVTLTGEPNAPAPWFDCDDPDDLTAARRWVAPR
jgi:molybdopterin-guanine dinucleotide biosynthesis protein A